MPTRTGKKIGLALGGGAARGIAHIGVLEVLERENIPIDVIAGTSAGALVGALYAQGKKSTEIKEIAQKLDWKKRLRLIDLALPRMGFIGGRRLKELVNSITGDIDFKDLKIPLSCVATDIVTGEEIVINEGSVLEAVRASVSLPVIFAAVKRENRYLVDGGLVNQVPVSVARQMGADIVIAVNVLPHLEQRAAKLHKKEKSGKEKKPSLFDIITQTINISSSRLLESSLSGADVIIEPVVPGGSGSDFSRFADYIRCGQEEATMALPQIQKLL